MKFPPFSKNLIHLLLWNLLVVIPSFRFLFKFSNIFIVVLYALLLNSIFLFRRNFSFPNYQGFSKLLFAFVAAITVVNYFVYPRVHERGMVGDGGSTADDAMILSANSLKTTGKLYDLWINSYTPVSPGPGWVLLNSPFVLSNLYFLFIPFYLFLLTLFLSKTSMPSQNIFIFGGLLASAVFWELLFNGHDIIPFSILIFILTNLLYRTVSSSARANTFKLIFLSILLGIACTSRIIFILLPFILSIIFYKKNRRKALLLLFISMLVFSVLHCYYYYINKYYQPLHLFDKARNIFGTEFLFVFAAVVSFFLFILSRQNLSSKKSFNLIMLSIFVLIFVPLCYGDLVDQNFDFTKWEGANYIFPIIPFALIELADGFKFRKNFIDDTVIDN